MNYLDILTLVLGVTCVIVGSLVPQAAMLVPVGTGLVGMIVKRPSEMLAKKGDA
jgi:hypothetical protein